jgi:hypothetical protein
VTRSEEAITSSSLCVMKMMVRPSAVRAFKTVKSSFASYGVRTDVGSSRMRMSTFR